MATKLFIITSGSLLQFPTALWFKLFLSSPSSWVCLLDCRLLPVRIGFLLYRWIDEERRLRHFMDKVKLFGFVCYIYLLSLSCSTGSLLCTSQCYWCVLILISVELILAIVNFCYWCVLTFNFSGTDPSNFEFLLRNLLHLCRKL